jgi:excisionase family DNA binding protein
VAEAAAALALGETSVRRLIRLKQIEHYRTGAKGGVIRIPEHAIASYQAKALGRVEEQARPESVRVGRKHLGGRRA